MNTKSIAYILLLETSLNYLKHSRNIFFKFTISEYRKRLLTMNKKFEYFSYILINKNETFNADQVEVICDRMV